MREPENEDGQLYTLGLLERLREQTGLIQGTYADLYRIVDKLLREIENPNLHDIANLNYRVELWDRYASQPEPQAHRATRRLGPLSPAGSR
jgi:hypothetical protein